MRYFFLFLALLFPENAWWVVQDSGVDSNLRGICVVSASANGAVTIWASGWRGCRGALDGFRKNLAESAHSGWGIVGFSRSAGVRCEYSVCHVQRGWAAIANLQDDGWRSKLETPIQ